MRPLQFSRNTVLISIVKFTHNPIKGALALIKLNKGY
jgi:hypothetical protein